MGALSFSEIEVFMSFFDTFAQMSVLFMMVIVGFCCNKLHYMDQDFNRKLSSLILNVTAPFLILPSVMGSTLPAKEDILPVLIAGLSSMVFVMIVAVPITMLLRIKKEEAGIYRFMLIFGNINFIGFPVVGEMFGPEAIFYASVLTIPFYFFIFLLGVILVTAGRGKATFSWRMFFSPCLVATYISIILVLLEIKAPATVSEACHLIGGLTISGSLLIIGSTLAELPVLHMLGTPKLYLITLIKLLGLPVVIYGIFLITPLEKKYADVLVILAGMPVASIGTMLCLKNGVDSKVMAQGTFLTTLFSIVSIPLLAIIL